MFRLVWRYPTLLALLAVLLGAFLRFHQLGRVPPGLHYDFAANALLANNIAFGNFREVFISAYTGKEVLFFYTAALIFKFVGSSIFTLQLTAALYGVLGLAACHFAARQLTWGWPQSKWIAAFATAVLAFTFMHLVWSRYGERATTEPLVQGLAIGFLFRGLRFTHSPLHPHLNFLLAGAFTGLAAYTYLAARLFPIPIALTLILFLISEYRRPHPGTSSAPHLFKSLALFAFAALLVFAPLGLFFLQQPETFLVRANQLTPKAGETGLLVQGIFGALGMIFISGEPYDRFNIPGRPIFDPLLGLFFIIGLIFVIVKLLNSLRNKTATQLTSPTTSTTTRLPDYLTCLFLLTYTLTFLLPTALSVHDIFPSNVRSMGLLPVLTIFPAIGLVQFRSRLLVITKPYTLLTTDHFLLFTFLLTLLFGTASSYNSYFNVWATAPSLHYANDTDLVEAARWINTQDTLNTSVYFSAIHYRHPTVAYLARDFESFRWFTGGQSLALPTGPALYVFPHSAPPPQNWIAQWTPVESVLGPDGTPDFRAYRFDSGSPPPLPNFLPASANFGNLIALTGYRVPEPGTVDLRLRVLNPPNQPDYRFVADLVDPAGYYWTQAFNDSYFAEQWQVDETILVRLKFATELGTPPGDYKLLLTVYSASSKTNLPALTADGYSAAYAALGPIPIARSDPQPLIEPLVTVSGVNVIQLDPPPRRIRQGERLPFTLRWQVSNPITNNQSLTIKLGALILESTAPVHNTYPFDQWLPGEIVIDRHAPRLPRDLAPGVYNLTLNDYLIGTVTVEALDRQLSRPTPLSLSNAKFDDLVELIGYDLRPDSITVYWQALKETDTDYTAFVHVLDENGNILAQHDSQPREGGYPTSLWITGEYVSDTIQIPTTGRAIALGWYVAETGERLKTESGEAVRIRP